MSAQDTRDAALRAAQDVLNEVFAMEVGREPRYRYFGHRGWLYCWTTERMGDGKYASFVYRPIGPGSQSGKAKRWKLTKETHFTKRSTAKAHALNWYRAACKQSRERAAMLGEVKP